MNRSQIEVETTIQAPQRVVWDVITQNPSAMFMGAKVETDWKVGHPITMSGEFKEKSFKDSGEIRSYDVGRELSFTHVSGASQAAAASERGNLVTIRLRREGDATRIALTQTPLDARELDEAQRQQFRKNWSTMLQALKAEAEKAPAARS